MAYLRRQLLRTNFDAEHPENPGEVTDEFDIPANHTIVSGHWQPGWVVVTWLVDE